MGEIGPDFFRREPLVCARELIGCTFRWNGCEGKIVETEAYLEFGDEACHTWSRPSAREFIAHHQAGTSYVYLNYGMHWLFNVLTKSAEGSGFVLFRALEPLNGRDLMFSRRGDMPLRNLCSGPGKLTKALGINGKDHGKLFLECADTGIEFRNTSKVVTGPRVGISRASDRPWRFGLAGSKFLSGKF
jgi:DNA-3-methyladenine glycosylase